MDVPGWLWAATIGGFAVVLLIDLWWVDRRPHAFGPREATRWVIFYIVLALLFAVAMWQMFGAAFAGQFLAGYLTEYSLSVDNLFVFLVIMSSFAVPERHQHRVLLVGVVLALLLRGILIVVGAAAIERFEGVLLLFGVFLLWTAWTVARSHDAEPDPEGNAVVRWVERVLPTTRQYHDAHLVVRIDGKRVVTPMLLVMIAIGTTDLLFALDSIPAVFGLTQEAFIVFAANAFALMGLRQLYFLLHGLLDKLIYLSRGLAVILAFIGIKLLLEGAHAVTGAEVPTIGIALSLAVIVSVLLVTTATSLLAVRRHPELVASSEEARAEIEAGREAGVGLAHVRDVVPGDDPEGDGPDHGADGGSSRPPLA